MRTHTLTVESAEAGGRLDVWLRRQLPDLSRARIQALLASGDITVNSSRPSAHTKVKAGMVISVHVPPPVSTDVVPEAIPLDILHEDLDIILINKPPGLVVHPAAGHPSGTLVNALLHHCDDLKGVGGEMRPGIVHRLDKDTSGVMVAAKHDLALEGLAAQFKAGQVHKEYVAIVHGRPERTSDVIETLIGRSSHDRKKMSAQPNVGREAVTRYEVEEQFAEAALLRVRIETGRTHQIRVHMAHIGLPIVGDHVYGRRGNAGPQAPRQMLHAHTLGFTHPGTGAPISFCAPIPEDMAAVLAALTAGA